MLLKWFFVVVLLALMVLDEKVEAGNPCENYTTKECLRLITGPSKRGSAQQQQSTNLVSDPALFESLLKPTGESTCKLKDIFNILSNECRTELLQILNLLLTNPDY